jgi:hypothetical protein
LRCRRKRRGRRADRGGVAVQAREQRSAQRGCDARKLGIPRRGRQVGGAAGYLPGHAGGARTRILAWCGDGRRVGERRRRCQGQRRGPQREAVGQAHPAQQGRALGHGLRNAPPEREVDDRRGHDHGQRSSSGKGGADDQPRLDRPEGECDAGERPHCEREHERGERQSQQDPVQGSRQCHRHPPARGLGHLMADLRHDANAERVERAPRERDGHRHRVGRMRQGRPDGRQRHERRQRPGQRPDAERDDGGNRGAATLAPAARTQRLDHGEPAWRPRAGQPGEERSDAERDQHLVAVS